MDKQNKTMQCNISRLSVGLKRIEQVEYIKIKSKDYNLLILVDFQSTLGEIEDGSIEVLSNQNSYRLDDVNGFYLLKDNVFSVLLKEE